MLRFDLACVLGRVGKPPAVVTVLLKQGLGLLQERKKSCINVIWGEEMGFLNF